jgi:spore germination cell wall hydrolase CwlJ-like protein
MTATFTLMSEPTPRDFSARLRRSRARSLRSAKSPRHHGRRALVLLAAVALPAFATPGDWGPGLLAEIGSAGRAEAAVAPMPFERAGDSFPGSAFYYLAASAAPPLGQGIHSDAENAPTAIDPLAGPAARALRVDNSGVDRSRALQCLTAAIYYEAASEPDGGQRAVAQVVLNRVAHPAYPKTVCGVVFQGSEKNTGCQFSFTCDGALARVPNRMFWQRAEAVAAAALSGYVYTPVGLATHYHTTAVHPYWADKLTYIGQIGAHRFYRFGGPAGAPATFRFAYLGGEPLPQPNARGSAPAVAEPPAADPVAIQRAYESGLKAAQSNANLANASMPATGSLAPGRAAPPPVYSAELQSRGGDALYRGDHLPGATGILPEYQQSGRWIAQPN